MEKQTGETQETKREVTQQEALAAYQEFCDKTGWRVAIAQQTEQTADGGFVNIHKLTLVKKSS